MPNPISDGKGNQYWVLDPRSIMGPDWFWMDSDFHRLDGPALIFTTGDVEWWINGIEITNEVNEWIIESNANPNWKDWTDSDKIMFRMRFS